MKRSWKVWLAAVALLTFMGQIGRAEEIDLKPSFEPFKAVRSTTSLDDADVKFVNYAEGEAQSAGCGSCSSGCNSGCNSGCGSNRHVGRDFWVCSDRCCGIIGGIDFLMIRPYGSAGLFDTAGGAQMNFNPSMRYWLGYQRADGLGARIRYWEFNRNAVGRAQTSLGAEFRTLDAELTQTVDFRAWNFLFSGGLRYGETNVNRTDANLLNSPYQGGFSGVGLTASAQATRNLNQCGSLRFMTTARWSALYGNSSSSIVGGPIGHNRDDLVNILELNIGPQYRRQLRNGSYLTMGAGIESQYWSNAAPIGPGNTGYDIGFLGFSSSVAITR